MHRATPTFIRGALTIGLAATLAAPVAARGLGSGGAVFTATNGASGNAVVAFRRSARGALSHVGNFSTGGNGTGSGLGNQGGVVLDDG